MKQLPEYAFLTNSVGFTGMKIISLRYPYVVASIIEVGKNQTERMSDLLDDMVQGRYPIAKVKGYSIFVKTFTTLEQCDKIMYHQEILNEMADFILTERIQKKPGQFKGMKED